MSLKTKYQNWLEHQINKAMWFHESKKHRLIFRLYFSLFMLVILLILIGSIIIIYFGGLSFKEEGGYYLKNPHNDIYLAVGSILFIIGCLIGIFGNIYLCYLFQKSKEKFFQTEKFIKEKEIINASNLSNKSIKELKWLKKLGYLSKSKYQLLISQKRQK